MNIFEKRIEIKPYEYPELLQYKDAIRHSYWLHTEYNLTGDIHNYKVGISNVERNCIKNAMLAVAQIEVAVKTFWGDIYKRLPKPEIADVGYTFAESEVRHKDAYSFLLERLGLNKDFEKIHEIPAIIDRMNYLNRYLSGSKSKKDEDYALTILLFSLFIEHVSLFSQFLIIMSFNKHKNLFKGMSNIVEATSKEETIHAQFGIEIIRIIKKEHPEWFGEEKEQLVETLCKKAYKAEKKVLSWILEAGELDFISEAVIDNFIRQRFNEALEAIGFQPIFEVNQEQLAEIEWFELEMLSTKDYDFFNKRPVDYSKKTKTFSSNNLF